MMNYTHTFTYTTSHAHGGDPRLDVHPPTPTLPAPLSPQFRQLFIMIQYGSSRASSNPHPINLVAYPELSSVVPHAVHPGFVLVEVRAHRAEGHGDGPERVDLIARCTPSPRAGTVRRRTPGTPGRSRSRPRTATGIRARCAARACPEPGTGGRKVRTRKARRRPGKSPSRRWSRCSFVVRERPPSRASGACPPSAVLDDGARRAAAVRDPHPGLRRTLSGGVAERRQDVPPSHRSGARKATTSYDAARVRRRRPPLTTHSSFIACGAPRHQQLPHVRVVAHVGVHDRHRRTGGNATPRHGKARTARPTDSGSNAARSRPHGSTRPSARRRTHAVSVGQRHAREQRRPVARTADRRAGGERGKRRGLSLYFDAATGRRLDQRSSYFARTSFASQRARSRRYHRLGPPSRGRTLGRLVARVHPVTHAGRRRGTQSRARVVRRMAVEEAHRDRRAGVRRGADLGGDGGRA